MAKITMEDIARISGVSKATVSYVLNGKTSLCGISKSTEEKVLRTAEQMNYLPDRTAVLLARQKNEALSVHVCSPWLYAQYSDFMALFHAALKRESGGQGLKVSFEQYEYGELFRALKPGKCKRYDAVFVIGSANEDNGYLEKQKKIYENVILINRVVPGYPCVFGNDEEISAHLAARASKAYSRCVIVGNGPEGYCRQQRVAGFLKGCREAEQTVLDGSSEEALRGLLDGCGEQRTLFCFSQYYPAARMLRIALQSGYAVPERIGIIAYDIHTLLRDFVPRTLTTVDPDITRMTETALALARERKRGGRPGSVQVPGKIIQGETAILKEQD